MADRTATAAIERWFVRRGLPHFIDDYSAGTDIWTRSLPILAIAYVAGGLNALDIEEWSAARNLVAAAVAVAVLAVGVVVANLVRGAPALSVPRVIGFGELAVFVLGPSVPPLLFGQPGDALQSALTGVAVLAFIYVVTSYGLIPMTKWGFLQLGDQIADLGRLVVKALPLLLLFITFLFMTAESWQVAAALYGPTYWLVLGLFFVIGAAFVLSRVPGDLAEINRFADAGEAARLAAEVGAPVAALDGSVTTPGDPAASIGEAMVVAPEAPAAAPDAPAPALDGSADPEPFHWPLGRRAWANVVLVMLVAQAIQITLVAVVIGAFLIVFGVLAVDQTLVETWSDSEAHVFWSPTLGGRELALTEQLLRVSGFLAAFTALYFTVYLITDPTYRTQFRDEVVSDVRGALAARACYLAARTGRTA